MSLLTVTLAGATILSIVGWLRASAEARQATSAAARAGSEAERRYQQLTDSIAAAIVLRDAAGVVRYCNRYTEVLTGYSVNDVVDGTDRIRTITNPEDLKFLDRAESLLNLGEQFQFTSRITHRSGIELWTETRVVPISNPDGALQSSLSIIVDVTAQVARARKLEERNRDLHDFSYMVSHDLKAPLCTIQGMLGYLQQECGGALPEQTREPIQHMQRAADRLHQLVSSVLKYAEVSATEGAMDSVNLADVLADVTNDYRHEIAQSGGSLESDPMPAIVRGDRTRLYQVLANLIGNAIKYRAEARPMRITLQLRSIPERGLIQIEIADNGLGIPASKIASVFRPFQRFHQGHADGSGIGLATAHRIVEKHGGEITVTSREGVGTTFTIRLPIAERLQTESRI